MVRVHVGRPIHTIKKKIDLIHQRKQLFKLFKKEEKEKTTIEVHNRIIDIRIGREYARGDSMGGNTYQCFSSTAEEAYQSSLENSDDLKNVNKEYFIKGYDLQKEELSHVVNMNSKS